VEKGQKADVVCDIRHTGKRNEDTERQRKRSKEEGRIRKGQY
jgi:hypothetical protein